MTVAAAARSAPTIAAAVDAAARALAGAGIPEARREARILVAHGLGAGAESLTGHPERELSPAESGMIAALIGRRCERRPLAQVTGRREFWSLDFAVDEHTLDPRPDSECVVEAVLGHVDREAPLRILDLGTGTGCLLLALLHELPGAEGTGVDISAAALKVAGRNAAALGLGPRSRFVQGDWGRGLEGPFAVIVANPPYIPAGALPGLQPEVARFEPKIALDGGADGLAAYRALAPDVARLLTNDGFAVVECGEGQGAAVAEIMDGAGLTAFAKARDLGGRERALVLKRARG
jgi:release factor glutamine methyltransferase